MNSKNIIIIHTYFHAKQLKLLDFVNNRNSTVFYSPQLNFDIIKTELNDFKLISLPLYNFSKQMFKKNILTTIKNTRNDILNIKKYITRYMKEAIFNNKSYNIVIFTEKDLFNQVLLSTYHNLNNIKIISVDEGIGHYRKKNNFLEESKNVFYNLFGLLFLNFKFNYVVALGRDKRVDEVYLRFPELVNKKEYISKIKKLSTTKDAIEHATVAKTEKKILLLTSPLSEDSYCTYEIEKKLILDIVNILHDNQYEITLKAHPREIKNKYCYLKNIKLINPLHAFETLNIKHYSYIINFGSSIVLNIYQKKIPLNNIITYKCFPLHKYQIFQYTNIVNNIKDLKEVIQIKKGYFKYTRDIHKNKDYEL